MPDTDLEPRDVLAIHQLLALYGHCLDDGEFDRLRDVFTPDATVLFVGRDRPPIEGIDAIVEFFTNAAGSSAHHASNILLREHLPGEVHVRSKFFVPYTRPEHDAHRWYGGTYDDVVVETDDGWRIRRRVVTGRWQLTTDDRPVREYRRTY
ncbi:nuclear transport factor 2 family protein [Geodermatophilus sp. URMC 64]